MKSPRFALFVLSLSLIICFLIIFFSQRATKPVTATREKPLSKRKLTSQSTVKNQQPVPSEKADESIPKMSEKQDKKGEDNKDNAEAITDDEQLQEEFISWLNSLDMEESEYSSDKEDSGRMPDDSNQPKRKAYVIIDGVKYYLEPGKTIEIRTMQPGTEHPRRITKEEARLIEELHEELGRDLPGERRQEIIRILQRIQAETSKPAESITRVTLTPAKQ